MPQFYTSKMVPKYQIASLSESAIVISFEQIIDEGINDFIRLLDRKINKNPFPGFVESVPAYASLTVYYDLLKVPVHNGRTAQGFVRNFTEELINKYSFGEYEKVNKSIVEIPVIYDGEDLDFVCEKTGLSVSEFIKTHTEPLYRVYMMGFLPGFAYLGGMDKRLAVPRRSSPRKQVPAGSVGIAGEQTGIYPVESPGGWQLIGRTEKELLINDESQLTLLKQGDYVRFYCRSTFS